MSREPIDAALFALISASPVWATASRRLILPAETGGQPALFLRSDGEHWDQRRTGMPAIVTLHREAWIYFQCDPQGDAPSAVLNSLVDTLIAALQPPPGQEKQTLGGLVTHCWVEGEMRSDAGDISGQGVAIVPIKVMTSTLGR